MANRAIREFDGKRMISNLLSNYVDSDKFLPNRCAKVAEDIDINEVESNNPWLKTEKLVVKPDQLLKRRGNNNLLLLNADWKEAKKVAKKAGEKAPKKPPKPKKPAPKRQGLPKGTKVEDVTFEMALELLALPRDIGTHPETGKIIQAGIGRFGPFVKHNNMFASIPKDGDVMTIGMNRAVDLLAEKEKKVAAKEAAKAAGKTSKKTTKKKAKPKKKKTKKS